MHHASPVNMFLEDARDLSIQDILRVLKEKLSLECTQIRVIQTSHSSLRLSGIRSEYALSDSRSNGHGSGV